MQFFRASILKRRLAILSKLIYGRRGAVYPSRLRKDSIATCSTSLGLLWKGWRPFGYIPSDRERSSAQAFASAHPSLGALSRAVGFLEKSTLLMLAPLATEAGSGQRPIIKGSLTKSGTAAPTRLGAAMPQALLLASVANGGAFEPWPSCPLRPLALTYATLNGVSRRLAR
jgi:hypothetical protein